MEILSNKVPATPLVANLEFGMVTYWIKRRKSGSRVIRHFSPENNKNDVPTCSTSRKAICGFIVRARFHATSRGYKSAMLYNDTVSTGESLCPPSLSVGERYANQRKECSKWETGSRIAR